MQSEHTYHHLPQLLKSWCLPELLHETRVHRIPTFDTENARVWVKREDETGFGISGCKKRKYASLIPWLEKNGIKHAGIIGGSKSNHVVSLLQLLNERRIQAHLFLKAAHEKTLKGNFFFTRLLADVENISWIAHDDWTRAEAIANDKMRTFAGPSFVIPEGGSCFAAFPGAATLVSDIQRNESELASHFDHIFIDSGTGLIAGSLALMAEVMKIRSQVHVVLVAGSEAYFQSRVTEISEWFTEIIPYLKPGIIRPSLYRPVTSPSFGSVNRTIMDFVILLAREEGLLTDPVYTAKLFLTAKEVIKNEKLNGNILIVHSGGGTGLSGFDSKFEKIL